MIYLHRTGFSICSIKSLLISSGSFVLFAVTLEKISLVGILKTFENDLLINFPEMQNIYEILEKAPGIKILDDRENNLFPEPLIASGKNDVYVGRIRKSLIDDKTLELFIVGDQLLKGAALNAVEIYEHLVSTSLLKVIAIKDDYTVCSCRCYH